MQLWSDVVGANPVYFFEPLETLPSAARVLDRIRKGAYSKAVALVGYRDDAEASEASRHLPYGHRGEGIEEIVFVREVPIDRIVEFEDDAWPGEDRTYVQDDLDAAIELIERFAVDDGPAGSAILVTGGYRFVQHVAEVIRAH